jgi:acetolactate synthase regulatory subunit
MHAFHIQYRNTQGTLMRILTAVSRRGIEVVYLLAEASGSEYRLDLLLDVNPKQVGQLSRDWHAIVDVTDVRFEVTTPLDPAASFGAPHSADAARMQSAAASVARA